MIVFLTLLFCGVLALLVKFNVVTLNLWWKISPVIWFLFLLVVLFIPMQWAAPTGYVNVYQPIVEVIPNVSGQVTEVNVQGLQKVEKGDVLFKLDPVPYQAVVDQCKSQLADAKQKVLQLKEAAITGLKSIESVKAEIEIVKSNQKTATTSLASAEAMAKTAQSQKLKGETDVKSLTSQVATAQREYDRFKQLSENGDISQQELDTANIQLIGLQGQLDVAKVNLVVLDDSIAEAQAEVEKARANVATVDLQLKQLVDAELPRVQSEAKQADLAANSMIGDQHTLVATVSAELEKATYDLEQTTIVAPSDGMPVAVSLAPGQRVGSLPIRSWMTFVPKNKTIVSVGIPQYAMRYVKPGQAAEVTFKLFPGKVFAATVEEIVPVSADGQIQPSGVLPTAPGVNQNPQPFAVRLRLESEAGLDIAQMPGGAAGTAAIYTDTMKPTHMIRKVMLRMQALINYVSPW